MKTIIICASVLLSLVPVAIAAGKWLDRIEEEFQEAENLEND